MRFSMTALITFVVLAFLGSSAIAVGVTRMAPSPRGIRVPCEVVHVGLKGTYFEVGSRRTRWLDTRTGCLDSLNLDENESLDDASTSPWRDEWDHFQVVGRWSARPGSGRQGCEMGLARFSFPDGRLINLVETETLPVGPPCWLPGSRARVVFAAADGQLYQFAFEGPSDAPRNEVSPDERPRPLEWRSRPPDLEGGFVSDPCLPANKRFNNILFVSHTKLVSSGRRSRFAKGRIWWLRLSDDGHAIEEGGPLFDSSDGSVEMRFPTVGTDQAGGAVLAYLCRIEGGPWQLRTHSLTTDPVSRVPLVANDSDDSYQAACRPSSPVYSSNGRDIFVLESRHVPSYVVLRIPLQVPSKAGRFLSAALLK